MRIGPLEIALIIVVVFAVALIARIIRLGRRPVPVQRSKGGGSGTDGSSGRSRGFFNWTGAIFIVGGFIVLAAAVSLFRWVLQSYLWGLVLIAGGVIMVLLARRRRA